VPVRTPLGEANIIRDLATLLQRVPYQQTNFQIQALRVLGNLCFDNGKQSTFTNHKEVNSKLASFFLQKVTASVSKKLVLFQPYHLV
jgi:hypothetical protein